MGRGYPISNPDNLDPTVPRPPLLQFGSIRYTYIGIWTNKGSDLGHWGHTMLMELRYIAFISY
jgi:hypothetical protein